MLPDRSPAAAERRRAASRLLERLLIGLLLATVLRRGVQGRAPPAFSPEPLTIDLARDPPARLCLLPGIGPARAAALARHRERFGPPRTWDDLDAVPGLGPARLAALREARELRVLLAGEPLGPDAP